MRAAWYAQICRCLCARGRCQWQTTLDESECKFNASTNQPPAGTASLAARSLVSSPPAREFEIQLFDASTLRSPSFPSFFHFLLYSALSQKLHHRAEPPCRHSATRQRFLPLLLRPLRRRQFLPHTCRNCTPVHRCSLLRATPLPLPRRRPPLPPPRRSFRWPKHRWPHSSNSKMCPLNSSPDLCTPNLATTTRCPSPDPRVLHVEIHSPFFVFTI